MVRWNLMLKKILIAVSIYLACTPALVSAGMVNGTPDNDIIKGSFRADTLYGHAGEDTINGYAGMDYIEGGADNDTIHAGFGDDYVIGGPGADYIDGSFGDDYSDGGEGFDYCLDDSGTNIFSNCEFLQLNETGFWTSSAVNAVIGNEGLAVVLGGPGLDIVVLPVEAPGLKNMKGSESIMIRVVNKSAVDSIKGALSNQTTGALNESIDIERSPDGSYSIFMSALSIEAAAQITADLFTTASDGSSTLPNPYTGEIIEMTDVDFIGFRNTPLIPVAAK